MATINTDEVLVLLHSLRLYSADRNQRTEKMYTFWTKEAVTVLDPTPLSDYHEILEELQSALAIAIEVGLKMAKHIEGVTLLKNNTST